MRNSPNGPCPIFERCRGGALAVVAVLLLGACGSLPQERDEANAAPAVAAPARRPASPPVDRRPRDEPPPAPIRIQPEWNVFFTQTGVAIADQDQGKIQRVADQLVENKDLTVTLVGYADNLGSGEYAVAVADLRVSEVARVLLKRGVRPLQVRKVARGYDADLVRACTGARCGDAMRRVEMRLSDRGG